MVLFKEASLAGASVKTKISEEVGAPVKASCELHIEQEKHVFFYKTKNEME